MTSRAMRALPGIVCVMILAGAAGACKDEKTEVVSLNVVGDSVPTMTTHTVTTLISDSGQIRYRVTTDNWLVYDEAQVPMWRFPDGLYLEKFDKDFGIEATVQCDSATYFSQRGLWRLDGNVNILNTVGEKFLSQQVFWDQRLNKVYSDSFIHIERADRTIEGYGFESNDKMTNYRITNPTGIFPASDFNPGKESGAADAPWPTVWPKQRALTGCRRPTGPVSRCFLPGHRNGGLSGRAVPCRKSVFSNINPSLRIWIPTGAYGS